MTPRHVQLGSESPAVSGRSISCTTSDDVEGAMELQVLFIQLPPVQAQQGSGVYPLTELGCPDEFDLLWPKRVISQWQRDRDRRSALREERQVDPPAAKALRQALEWDAMMRKRGWTRSRLANEVGYTRARVTQIMHLLNLPIEVKERLLAGAPSVGGMTIREAVQIARQAR